MAVTLNRLLGFSLEDLYRDGEEFTKKCNLNKVRFDRNFYVNNFLDSLTFIESIHQDAASFKSFTIILSRSVGILTEEEISEHNLLEILYRECFISSNTLQWTGGGTNQYAMATLLKFMARRANKSETIAFMKKYPHQFHDTNAVLWETYKEISR